MNPMRASIVSIPLILALGTVSCSSKEKKEKEKQQQQAQMQQQQQQQAQTAQVTDVILVPEAEFLAAQRLPLALMTNSRQELKEKNFGEASANLKTAARLLSEREKEMSSGAAKNELATASMKLNRLAPEVQAMRNIDEAKLTAHLADIAYHIGASHRLQAEEQLRATQYKRAGFNMATSTAYIERGTEWTGQQVDPNQLSQIRSTSAKLIRGSGWSQPEVNQAIGRLDAVSGNLGNRITAPPLEGGPEGRQPASQPHTHPSTQQSPSTSQGQPSSESQPTEGY